jgi:hypothetical protein
VTPALNAVAGEGLSRESPRRRVPIAQSSSDDMVISSVVSWWNRLGGARECPSAPRTRTAASLFIAIILAAIAAACLNPPMTVLQQLNEARRLTADLLLQFSKAGDAANRAVMADTDETSVAFAREAEQATLAVQRDADALKPLLVALDYSKETRLLEEFGQRFTEYRGLDRSVIDLAVENTNLKAQRLSFGPAHEAAAAFSDALEGLPAADATKNGWRVTALVAAAVASLREIEVLQAPHIAAADEAAMTRLEQRMASQESAARKTLETLPGLVRPDARPKLAAATAALDTFAGLNTQIVSLSRRNSNVRSLALSLGQKRNLTAACEDSLRALQDALATRGFTGTR